MSKSGVTFVFFFTLAFVPFYMTCKMCTYFCQNVTDCLETELERRVPPDTPGTESETLPETFRVCLAFVLVCTEAGNDRKVLVII